MDLLPPTIVGRVLMVDVPLKGDVAVGVVTKDRVRDSFNGGVDVLYVDRVGGGKKVVEVDRKAA